MRVLAALIGLSLFAALLAGCRAGPSEGSGSGSAPGSSVLASNLETVTLSVRGMT